MFTHTLISDQTDHILTADCRQALLDKLAAHWTTLLDRQCQTDETRSFLSHLTATELAIDKQRIVSDATNDSYIAEGLRQCFGRLDTVTLRPSVELGKDEAGPVAAFSFESVHPRLAIRAYSRPLRMKSLQECRQAAVETWIQDQALLRESPDGIEQIPAATTLAPRNLPTRGYWGDNITTWLEGISRQESASQDDEQTDTETGLQDLSLSDMNSQGNGETYAARWIVGQQWTRDRLAGCEGNDLGKVYADQPSLEDDH